MSKIVKVGSVVDWRDLWPKRVEGVFPPYEDDDGWVIGFRVRDGDDANLPVWEVARFRPSAEGRYEVIFDLPSIAVDALSGRDYDYVLYNEADGNMILDTGNRIFRGAYNVWGVVRWGLLYGVITIRRRLYLRV